MRHSACCCSEKGVFSGSGISSGLSVNSNGKTAAESSCMDCTAAKTFSCQRRSDDLACSVSRRNRLRNHCSDWACTNHIRMWA